MRNVLGAIEHRPWEVEEYDSAVSILGISADPAQASLTSATQHLSCQTRPLDERGRMIAIGYLSDALLGAGFACAPCLRAACVGSLYWHDLLLQSFWPCGPFELKSTNALPCNSAVPNDIVRFGWAVASKSQ